MKAEGTVKFPLPQLTPVAEKRLKYRKQSLAVTYTNKPVLPSVNDNNGNKANSSYVGDPQGFGNIDDGREDTYLLDRMNDVLDNNVNEKDVSLIKLMTILNRPGISDGCFRDIMLWLREHSTPKTLFYPERQTREDNMAYIMDLAVRCGLRSPKPCLLYTSPSPRDLSTSRMPSSA